MRRGLKAIIVSAIAVSPFCFAAQAVAQGDRDKAIHDCIIRVQTQYPDVSNAANQSARLAAYRSCMQASGQNP